MKQLKMASARNQCVASRDQIPQNKYDECKQVRMNKFNQLILLLVLAGLTSQVVADTLSYTFVSATYSRFSTKIDGFSKSFKGDGLNFDLSVAVRPHIAIIAGYSMGSADTSNSGENTDVDLTAGSLGVMVHLPINKVADFIIAMSFFNGNAKVEKNGDFFAEVDADGGSTTLGFRAMASDKLEVNSFLNKISIEETSKFNISVGGAYYVVESVSVDLDFSLDGNGDSKLLAFGVTKYF